MSGDTDWAAGHRTMDAPQVHVYALEDDTVKAADIIAGWTELVWDRAEKPNRIGEFGVGGILWVQDLALEGKTISEVRSAATLRQKVVLEVQGMAEGALTVHPYHTWQGTYLDAFDLNCPGGQACTVPLPEFEGDMAFRMERK